jgi:hypothetical protein
MKTAVEWYEYQLHTFFEIYKLHAETQFIKIFSEKRIYINDYIHEHFLNEDQTDTIKQLDKIGNLYNFTMKFFKYNMRLVNINDFGGIKDIRTDRNINIVSIYRRDDDPYLKYEFENCSMIIYYGIPDDDRKKIMLNSDYVHIQRTFYINNDYIKILFLGRSNLKYTVILSLDKNTAEKLNLKSSIKQNTILLKVSNSHIGSALINILSHSNKSNKD